MTRPTRPSHQGFTLIELVTVIVVLGVVSVGISGFVRTGMDIYRDVSERDQILSDSRFVVERLSRELRGAIPNSARLAASGGTQCIEFVPALWVSYYTSLSVLPDITAQATIVEVGENREDYEITLPSAGVTGDYAFVYPTEMEDVYDGSHNKRHEVLACTDSNSDCSDIESGSDRTATLTLTGAFDDYSPASRLYFGRQSVSYCANGDGEIYRYQQDLQVTQTVYTDPTADGGVLMAQDLANTQPFTVNAPTLRRNGLVNVLLAFENNEEIVNYNVEVHIPNVP